MLRHKGLLVIRLGVLAALGGFSACVCGYTAGITNETNSPVFATFSSYWEGQRREDGGVLIPPHDQAELEWVFDAYLRIRDMSGNTIAFRYLPEGDDVDVVVSSLEPVPNPEPLGIPWDAGKEGPSEFSSRVCRSGRWEWVQEFRMTITVRSNFDGTLVVSGVTRPSDLADSNELLGVLVPPKGEASLQLLVPETAWIRAYDPQARLVFTKAVPKEPLPVVTIPASLPAEPGPLPAFDTNCEDRSSEDPYSPTHNLIGDGVGAGVILFVAGLAGTLWWRIRRRMRAG
jgi:hypothetical protein